MNAKFRVPILGKNYLLSHEGSFFKTQEFLDTTDFGCEFLDTSFTHEFSTPRILDTSFRQEL